MLAVAAATPFLQIKFMSRAPMLLVPAGEARHSQSQPPELALPDRLLTV